MIYSSTEEQDAFSHGYEYVKGKKLGVIILNPAVVSQLGSDEMRHTLHPRHLPMLVPPRPWRAVDDGAYLKTLCTSSPSLARAIQRTSNLALAPLQPRLCDTKNLRNSRSISWKLAKTRL